MMPSAKWSYFLLLVAWGCVMWPSNIVAQDLTSATEEVYQQLKQRKYRKLHSNMNDGLQSMLTTKKLRTSLDRVFKLFGEIQKLGPIHLDTAEGRLSTTSEIYLEKNTLNMLLSFSGDKLSQFQIIPQSYGFPDDAKNKVFGKKRLDVQYDTFKLSAELLFPITNTPPPVVIIVHGSGPMDMDGTIGPNKVYQDLALELALRGVATLRYDKRSKVYPKNFEKGIEFSHWDETLNDVQAAINLLLEQTEIDTSRIFVAGHSLGGYLAPMIGESFNNLAGIIMLAGPSEPLYELIPEQLDYIFGLQPKQKWIYRRIVKKARQEADLLRSHDYDQLKNPKYATAYWPVSYIKNLENYAPIPTLDSLTIPSLVLQGQRDYQVPEHSQYTPIVDSCGNNPLVSFYLFADLNHLFIPGEGKPSNLEYFRAGHVSPEVAEVIAGWIAETR
ncbi:MAG: prolyl oligopeptidase family serine peptidase [Bacteroidetes bacterium]|nr:prolyl oligopeptidase family serine peptidase [Bacteroidota bacterium]